MVFLSVDNPGAAGCFSGIFIHQGFMGTFQDAQKKFHLKCLTALNLLNNLYA